MKTDSNSSTPTSPVVLLSIGFLFGAVVVGACWLSSRSGIASRNDIVRNVTVDYMYEADPGSASGHSELAVDSIEFLPGYVVMTDTRGGTQLLALNRLRKFKYRPTEQ
jgi:hypothetical protein